jgi:hypothetical protein
MSLGRGASAAQAISIQNSTAADLIAADLIIVLYSSADLITVA